MFIGIFSSLLYFTSLYYILHLKYKCKSYSGNEIFNKLVLKCIKLKISKQNVHGTI